MIEFFRKIFYPKLLGGRSWGWRKVRKEWLKKHPYCEVCGRKSKTVHHIIPVHINKNKELDKTNLITLCHPHHFLIGHLMKWSSWNKEVKKDAEIWKQKISKRP